MKIVGGNFGVSGSAYLSRDNRLVIDGVLRAVYSPGQILSVSASVLKERKFGIFGFFVGAIVLGIAFGLLFGGIGAMIGIAIAAAGSFYSEKNNLVEVKFHDGKSVSLECTPRGVRKLVQFAPD